MMGWRQFLLAILLAAGVGLAWVGNVWAHRRTQGPLRAKQSHHTKTQTSANPLRQIGYEQGSENGNSNLHLSPGKEVQTFGEVSSSQDKLLELINVFPKNPERPALFLKMARRARAHGLIEKALKVYTLTCSLYPDTQVAQQAQLERSILEFYLELGHADPLVAFKSFLKKLAGFSSRIKPESLREPLLAGWQAVEQAMAARVPASTALVEEVLSLWELQPTDSRPPEAALLLGRLLQEQRLYKEAGTLFGWAWEKGSGQVRSRALTRLLELAWESQGLPGFLKTLKIFQQEQREIIPALRTWQLQLSSDESQGQASTANVASSLKNTLSINSPAEFLSGVCAPNDPSVWKHLLDQPLPISLKRYFMQGLAQRSLAEGDFSRAVRLYEDMLAQAADREITAFFWDRLGLSHIKGHQPESALEVFQGLEKEKDRFWRLLSRTRLLDMELTRLQEEPAS